MEELYTPEFVLDLMSLIYRSLPSTVPKGKKFCKLRWNVHNMWEADFYTKLKSKNKLPQDNHLVSFNPAQKYLNDQTQYLKALEAPIHFVFCT